MKTAARRDVFGQLLLIGYGKSSTFQLLHGVLSCLKAKGHEFPPNPLVVVILPLMSIVENHFGAIVRTRKGACTVINRSLPRSVGIVAWPVQRRFAYRAKFQKLFNDRGER